MFLSNLFSARPALTGNPQPTRTRLAVEGLEDRALLSAVTFNEPATRDITTVALARGDSYHVTGSYRADPDTTVPWYTDIDEYVIPLTPNSLIALKATTPGDTHVMPAYADLTYKGSAADGTAFYFNANKTSTTIRASSINRLGNYTFDLTVTPGGVQAPDLQVSNLRVAGGTATFDYKIVDPIPNRLNLVLNYVDLIGVKADGSSTFLRTRAFSTDPASAAYSPNSVRIDLAGLDLKPFTKLRIKATPSGWTESNPGNNTAEVALAARPADVRLNSVKAVNGTLTANATITGNVTSFLIGVYVLPQGVTSPTDSRAIRLGNINAKVNGQEGTFNFAVPIGPSGIRLPGAGADGRPDDYSLFAVADPDGKLAETNELNNAAPLTGWYLSGSNLFVQGGSGADTVRIAAAASGRVQFTFNGDTAAIPTGSGMTYFVRTHDGDDRLDVSFGNGSQRVVVSAFGGPGRDSVTVTGSAGNDTAALFADPSRRSSFVGPNYGIFFSDFTDATATGNGGNDTAKVTGSAGGAHVNVSAGEVDLLGGIGAVTARGFRSVDLVANGSDATAYLHGNGASEFAAYSDRAKLTGANFSHTVWGFKRVVADAARNGKDTATFYGTSTGTFLADPTRAEMTVSGAYDNVATGFLTVRAYGSGAAFLTASGDRDLLKASNVYANLTGTVGGASFSVYVKGFSSVTVDGKGAAQAMLYDTLNDDTLSVAGSVAILRDASLTYALVVKNFNRVRAVSQQGGNDRLVVRGDLNFQLETVGPWRS